jgi:hypothetical protein
MIPKFILYLYRLRNDLKSKIKQGQKIKKLIFHKYDLLVVPDDGVGGNSILIKKAQENNIPSLVYPYEYSTVIQPCEFIIKQVDYQYNYCVKNIINRIVLFLFPNWGFVYQGEILLREPGYRIIVRFIKGLMIHQPWSVHGGTVNRIAAESRAMVDHYREEGIPENKITLTGSVNDDIISRIMNNYDSHKLNIYNKYQLNSEYGLLLCSIPPNHINVRSSTEFNSYFDILDFWINCISIIYKYNILYQLHPRVSDDEKKFIVNKEVTVVNEPVINFIPFSDIHVTCVSSIIRWSISCGIPVINYDVYQYNYPDYKSVDGVITVNTKSDFVRYLNLLTQDKSYYREVKQKQMRESSRWGIHDGKSGERITQLIDELIAGRAN